MFDFIKNVGLYYPDTIWGWAFLVVCGVFGVVRTTIGLIILIEERSFKNTMTFLGGISLLCSLALFLITDSLYLIFLILPIVLQGLPHVFFTAKTGFDIYRDPSAFFYPRRERLYPKSSKTINRKIDVGEATLKLSFNTPSPSFSRNDYGKPSEVFYEEKFTPSNQHRMPNARIYGAHWDYKRKYRESQCSAFVEISAYQTTSSETLFHPERLKRCADQILFSELAQFCEDMPEREEAHHKINSRKVIISKSQGVYGILCEVEEGGSLGHRLFFVGSDSMLIVAKFSFFCFADELYNSIVEFIISQIDKIAIDHDRDNKQRLLEHTKLWENYQITHTPVYFKHGLSLVDFQYFKSLLRRKSAQPLMWLAFEESELYESWLHNQYIRLKIRYKKDINASIEKCYASFSAPLNEMCLQDAENGCQL